MGLLTKVTSTLHTARSGIRLLSTFRYDDLQISLTSKANPKPDNDSLVFGHNMTDHMLEIDWEIKDGWSAPVIRPLEPFAIHPAAKVLHYAPQLFEGLKAYRCVDKEIRLFRPDENIIRMKQTAHRTVLPDFDGDELLKCIKKLIQIEQEWVPYSDSCSLYVRPAFIGTEATLGITQSLEAKLFVILAPVGAYYPTGIKPISLLADPQYVRAWPGGSGAYKMGCNYAPNVLIQKYALKEKNCQQVLWLFGEDHQMTEVGTMNLFVYWMNENGEMELITPTLDSGLILSGITRKSMLELARDWNEFKVTEGTITMPQFTKALGEGRIKEVFGCGTACVVSPVDKIIYMDEELSVPVPESESSLAQRFFTVLTDINYYRTPHRWMEPINIDDKAPETLKVKTHEYMNRNTTL